jgi:hypothetical protein
MVIQIYMLSIIYIENFTSVTCETVLSLSIQKVLLQQETKTKLTLFRLDSCINSKLFSLEVQ